MQRKVFILLPVLFLILIGSLSIGAGTYSVNGTESHSEIDDSYVLDNRPVDYRNSLAEQDLELSQLVWSQTFSTPEDAWAHRVVECENGDYGILGLLSESGQYVTILMRIDSSGNQQWNRTFHYANDTYGNSLVLCSDGGFAIAGRIADRTIGGYYRGWLMKTNSTGHQQWNMTFGGVFDTFEGFTDLIQTSDGGFMLVGTDYPNLLDESDIVVAKTDENGTLLWAEYYYTYGREVGGSIIQCAAGGFAISGRTRSPFGGWESILMRIEDSELHSALWYRTFRSDGINPPLIECDNGDFLVGGHHALLRTDGNGQLKAVIDFPVRVYDAMLFDTNRIVITGDGRLVFTDENTDPMLNTPLGFTTMSIATCSNGEFVVLGYVPFGIVIARAPWLEWNETLDEVRVEYSTPFTVDLNATCSQGIESWSVNDTAHFDIDSQGVLTNIGVLDTGKYPLEIVVNDTLGNQLIQRFTVTVEDTTAPTWLQGPETVFLEAGDAFLYDLNATDVSGTLVWSLGATYTFAITQTGVITNTVQLAVGTYLIDVFVQDTSGNVLHGIVTLEVEDTQDPIYLSPPESLVVPYGEVIEFDIVAYDVSGIADWSQNCTDFTMLLDDEGPTTTAHFTSNGILAPNTYYVAMAITDFSANALEDVFWITVTEEDVMAPTWTEGPETQYLEFGDTFSYNLNATDSSGLDRWWLGDDTYFTISGEGLICERGPLDIGSYTVTVFVNDTLGNLLSCSVLVIVSDTTAPTWITTPANQVIDQDEALDYHLSATDLSGALIWSVNDTTHFSIDSQGHLRNIGSLSPGTYWVEITVSDIYGNNLSRAISVTVESVTSSTTTTTQGIGGEMEMLLIGMGTGAVGLGLVFVIFRLIKRR